MDVLEIDIRNQYSTLMEDKNFHKMYEEKEPGNTNNTEKIPLTRAEEWIGQNIVLKAPSIQRVFF